MMNRDAPGTLTPARDTQEPVERTPWFGKWSLRGAVIRALFAVGSFAVGLILGGIPPSHSSAVRLEDPPGVELYHTAQATESERQRGNRSGGPHGNTDLGRSEHRASQRLATSDTILELYETVGDDGRLTDGIKELAGLSEEGAAKVQMTMGDCWGKWEQLARERTTYSPAESNRGNKVWVYRIKSFVPEGQAVLDEMKERLIADVGARSADVLIRAFHPYQYFSNLGGFDVKLTHYMESDPALPIDQGIAYPAIDNTVPALDADWRITDHLARSLGLSSKERKAAQEVIDATRDRLKGLVKQHAEDAPELSDGSSGVSAFRVKPFMRLGHAELEVLDRSLKDNLPTAKADALFRYVRWRPHLGAYGANDVLIVFRKDSDSGAFVSAKLTRRNSMTGRVISGCDCGIEQMAAMEGFTPDMFVK